ncbi:hypothetical protein LCGC14_2907060, partial [marine sediment metagenome]
TYTVGGWTPSKTYTDIAEMLKKLIHLESPIFNIEIILNVDAKRQIEEERKIFDEKAARWTRRYAKENQDITITSSRKVEVFFEYKRFEWDLDKLIIDLKTEFKKLDISNPVEIQFMSDQGFLPVYTTLRELGIDPEKETINIRRTYMGNGGLTEETDILIELYNKEIIYVINVKVLRYFDASFNEWNLKCILNRESLTVGAWFNGEGETHEEIILDERIAFLTFKDEIKDNLSSFMANSIIHDFSNWDDFLETLKSKNLFYYGEEINWINFGELLSKLLNEEEFEFQFNEIKVKVWEVRDLISRKLLCRYLEFLDPKSNRK